MVESQSIENTPEKAITPQKPKAKKRIKKTKAPIQEKIVKKEISKSAQGQKDADKQNEDAPNKVTFEALPMDEITTRFPILKDEELVKKFLNVSMTNNQKGRIRQVLKDNLKGTSDSLLPEVIHSRIQSVLKTDTLTDSELRKVRILYNMLKTALVAEKNVKIVEKKTEAKPPKDGEESKKDETKKDKQQPSKKIKNKRYVVFLGNLPLNADKDMVMNHFSELKEHIVDVRIPKAKEEKKSAIAYVELKNESTYELALSRHHSMLGSKRINVLYTTQKDGKMTKSEAKSKSAKLQALQKSGKLIGSTPAVKKRSHRRAKLRQAREREQAAG